MKILLIGEFSGFYNALADGLNFHGHDVFLANTGDGSRKFYADYNWMAGKKGKFSKVGGILDLFAHKKLFAGYDVVQVIMPKLNSHLWLNRLFINYLVENNEKIFWTPAGTSDLVMKYWLENLENRCPIYDFHAEVAYRNKRTLHYEKKRFIDYERWFTDSIDGIIPISYEYAQPFRDYKNFLGTIPLPINIDSIEYNENIVNDKIVFHHGITRPVKGSKFICEAFDKMSIHFKKEAHFACNKNIPYNKYIELIRNTNVIADQTNSFSSGLTGLIGLAKGKIVLGGSDPISFKDLGYQNSPIFNIVSNVDQICDQIEIVIKQKKMFPELGRDARRFIEEHHHYINIASRYLSVWSNCSKNNV